MSEIQEICKLDVGKEMQEDLKHVKNKCKNCQNAKNCKIKL
jgi:hypothetical protein